MDSHVARFLSALLAAVASLPAVDWMVRHGIVEEIVSGRKLTNQHNLLAQAHPTMLKHLLVKEFYVSKKKGNSDCKGKKSLGMNFMHAFKGEVWFGF